MPPASPLSAPRALPLSITRGPRRSHAHGDFAIIRTARTIAEVVDESNARDGERGYCVPFRMGGDEFAFAFLAPVELSRAAMLGWVRGMLETTVYDMYATSALLLALLLLIVDRIAHLLGGLGVSSQRGLRELPQRSAESVVVEQTVRGAPRLADRHEITAT